jgi:hypothetical protein
MRSFSHNINAGLNLKYKTRINFKNDSSDLASFAFFARIYRLQAVNAGFDSPTRRQNPLIENAASAEIAFLKGMILVSIVHCNQSFPWRTLSQP